MRKLIGLTVFLFAIGMQLGFAQTREITGKVMDENGNPLPGTTVVVKGSSVGTATDIEGNFTLKASSQDALVFTFIGMKTQEIGVANKNKINVKMMPDSKVLDEIVITLPYGSSKKESFTGSAEVLSAENLKERTVSNITKALDGKVAGVISASGSGQPGEGAAIRIRGYGSINASNSPLYVVDGIPYDGNINAIDPNDIESMTILKDASAGALYGARGANGVVMITTKRGKSDREKINVNFKAVLGLSSRAIPRYETLNQNEWMEANYRAYFNDYVYTSGYHQDYVHQTVLDAIQNTIFAKGQYNPYDKGIQELFSTDGRIVGDANLKYDENWMDEIEAKNPLRQEYSLNIDGGSEKAKYLLSFGYLDEEGLLKGTSFERFSGRVNLDLKPKEWLNIGLGGNYARNKTNFLDFTSTATSNVWYSAQLMGPIYPVYEKDAEGNTIRDEATGEKAYDWGTNRPAGAQANFNSVATLQHDETSYYSDNFSARGFAELSKWDLKFRVGLGLDNINTRNTSYYNPDFGNAASVNGRLTKTSQRVFSYTFNQVLSYQKDFGLHSIEAMAGHEYYSYQRNFLRSAKTGFPFAGLLELAPGSTITDGTSSEDNYNIQGFFTRVTYDYADKYYLSGSFRTDGSSRFHKDSRWGKFWSIGASWRISEENFIAPYKGWLDNLTFKISYGVQGNDALLLSDGSQNFYAWQSFYDLTVANAGRSGAAVSSLETKNLKWELNKNLNTGIEIRVFDRLSATVEWYHKKTSDLLLNRPIATSLGFDAYPDNIGSMRNNGWDISLSGDIYRNSDWNWNMTLMGSTTSNKVLKLADDDQIISGSQIIKEKEELYSYYLVRSAGVDPTTGRQLYYAYNVDANGKKIPGSEYITSDKNKASSSREIMDSRIPKLYGSVTNSVTYKGFDFSLLLTYSIGGKMIDGVYNEMMAPLYVGQVRHKHTLRAWQKPGDVTDVPRLSQTEQTLTTDKDLVNASYLAIKNITFGYTFDKKLLGRSGIEMLRLFFTADNTATFTHLKGMNPQHNFSGGTDYVYAPNRIFSLGLDMKF